jgi:hypothetical protein
MAGLKPIEPVPGVTLDPRMIDQRSGKPKTISKRLKRAVTLLLTGECKTQKAAAERVGMNAGSLSRAFALPHIREFINLATRQALSEGQLVAGARLTTDEGLT